MRFSAIVPAAGVSRRMGRGVDKLYQSLKQKPLLVYSLSALEQASWVDEIILVVAPHRIALAKRLVRRYRLTKVQGVYPGGKTRTESVCRGMERVSPAAAYVLVHDGARPLLRSALLGRVKRAVQKTGAAVPALPVGPTIKRVGRGGFVIETLHREGLWEVQTPQMFRRRLLKEALHRARQRGEDATDCAALVERLGHRVSVVMGDPANLKVTTPLDLMVAESLLPHAVGNRF